MCPVEGHRLAAVGTNNKPGILVLLIHLCRSAFVLSYPLHDIPNLFGNDGRMRIFKHEAFFPWVFNFALVLIGFGAKAVVHSVAEIDLISNRFATALSDQWYGFVMSKAECVRPYFW